MSAPHYKLVKLANGVKSLHSLGETLHPGLGPAAEAEALYVRQLRLLDRLREYEGEFVIWDIGLGAAANALTIVRATQDLRCSIHLLSFDCTTELLEFALRNREALGYFEGCEARVEQLLATHRTEFTDGSRAIQWQLHLADFPSLIASPAARKFPKPDAIMFDAYSPARNPAMWTLPLFTNLFQLLDPQRPCVLPTYSRSTMLRVTLLLAGFFVGVGYATGEKEETTIAANALELIDEPLDRDWLQRAQRSHSAEPLCEAEYRQAPLGVETWERLKRHGQFGEGGIARGSGIANC